MRNHRTKDRRGPFRNGVLSCVSGFSVTFQNNRFNWVDIVPDKILTVTCVPELDAAIRNAAGSVRDFLLVLLFMMPPPPRGELGIAWLAVTRKSVDTSVLKEYEIFNR